MLIFRRVTFAVLALIAPPPVLTAQQTQRPPQPYESPALQALVDDAARVNAQIPERLRAYRARIETEMSLALTDSGGRERTALVEQIASEVRWRAPNLYEQRVVGHRSQSIGPMFSLMSIFGGWTTPTLYGNELQLGVTPATAENNWPPTGRSRLAVHPLAEQRTGYYRYSGGDTAVTLYSQGRRIPVVRVTVTPRSDVAGDAILFFGDMHLDADRKQIVRMRGRVVEIRNGRPTISAGSRVPGASGASFVELVNVEVNGEYWLPASQRTEMQARIALFGPSRTIVRIVSHFHAFRPNDSSLIPGTRADAPSRLSFAPSRELTRYRDWVTPIGATTTEAQYADFDDVAPAAWNTTRPTTGFRFRPRTLNEVFRFNRIEGLFTGFALERQTGASAEERTVFHGAGGWAWAEGTARGSMAIERSRGRTTTGVRLERTLVHTNDFELPLSWGSTLSALFGSIDDYDYLDRRSAALVVAQAFGARRRTGLRFEVGQASDNAVQRNISRGLWRGGEGFRENRGIRDGSYLRSVAALDFNPQVSGLFVDRGVGARIQYERADGDVSWQRLEFRGAARRELGPFQLYARADAGTLLGSPAPQAMFEIGRSEGLSAYGYKEFAGDRAAMARAVVGYTFPFFRAPMRLGSGLIAPGLAPGIAAGIHSAWTEISGPRAEQALLELGTRVGPTDDLVPLSRETNGIRSSAEVLVTFFSGALAVGVSRPIDRRGGWQFTGRIGQGF